jgi:hypothetical protein
MPVQLFVIPLFDQFITLPSAVDQTKFHRYACSVSVNLKLIDVLMQVRFYDIGHFNEFNFGT